VTASRTFFRRSAVGAVLGLALAVLGACLPSSASDSASPLQRQSAQAEDPAGASERLTVTGVLTGEGVECPVLRADDGRLYALLGDIGEAAPGDRLRVTGRVAEMSICMQGTALAVETVERF
jgi:hypothetical protein